MSKSIQNCLKERILIIDGAMGTMIQRHKLPEERRAITHQFEIAGHEGYITAGLYPDGQPGEVFVERAGAQPVESLEALQGKVLALPARHAAAVA